jgi:hypothetical protein
VGGGGHPSPLTGGGGVGAAGGASDSAAAAEYERLLLSGQRGAALAVATGAGLWAHAMLLARHIGEQHFAVTAAAMARAACTPGSPLHTLELMLAGVPQDLLGVNGGRVGGHHHLFTTLLLCVKTRSTDDSQIPLFTTLVLCVKTHSMDDSQYVPCNQSSDTREYTKVPHFTTVLCSQNTFN